MEAIEFWGMFDHGFVFDRLVFNSRLEICHWPHKQFKSQLIVFVKDVIRIEHRCGSGLLHIETFLFVLKQQRGEMRRKEGMGKEVDGWKHEPHVRGSMWPVRGWERRAKADTRISFPMSRECWWYKRCVVKDSSDYSVSIISSADRIISMSWWWLILIPESSMRYLRMYAKPKRRCKVRGMRHWEKSKG